MNFSPAHNLKLSSDDLALVEELAIMEARTSFWAYRRWINPGMLEGWWQYTIAQEFQRFYERLVAGERPYLVLSAPPQHGKTKQVTDFISWCAGKEPDRKQMYASYSDELGTGVNGQLQRILDGERYQRVFPDTQLSVGNVVNNVGRYARNSNLLEWVGRQGSFRNTTVRGQINGLGLGLGYIDDPLKGREEAQSKPVRDRAWDWLTDDFFGRFTDDAGLIMIMTRWHVDDPVARFITRFGKGRVRVLAWPAIATKDEMYRRKGEALFPEHKSKEFLLERKSLLTKAGWESVYQQSPIVVGGGLFPIEKMHVTTMPTRKEVKKAVRYWDKAGTEDGGAWTAGVLFGELKDGRLVVLDVIHGQWNFAVREERIKQAAEIDRANFGFVETWVEQEPGSGGKESAERTIANLRGYVVKADKVTGSKETRAEPYAAQVQGGNIQIVGAAWNRDFLDEHETFPTGKYKDQVDAAAGAFAKLVAKKAGSYDSSMSWVG
jgi:predicted phage terminase large subunit-like protein